MCKLQLIARRDLLLPKRREHAHKIPRGKQPVKQAVQAFRLEEREISTPGSTMTWNVPDSIAK
jgi:hypothetical protein